MKNLTPFVGKGPELFIRSDVVDISVKFGTFDHTVAQLVRCYLLCVEGRTESLGSTLSVCAGQSGAMVALFEKIFSFPLLPPVVHTYLVPSIHATFPSVCHSL
jgi:hypothetical protein